MAEFVVDHFKNRHGAGKNATKFLKAFALALVAVIEDDKNEYHDLCLLFAQMCGFYALSGRIQVNSGWCKQVVFDKKDRRKLREWSGVQLRLFC